MIRWGRRRTVSNVCEINKTKLPPLSSPLISQAVDTTGAGDAFVAGLLHQLCADPSLLQDAATGTPGIDKRVREAMTFACACGALVCQGAGAIDPQPTAAEAAAFAAARGG